MVRLFVSTLVAMVVIVSGSDPGYAHHGFTGRYDRSKPLYIEGRVTTATYNQPHALINIEPAPPRSAPQDLFSLDANSYSQLGGRAVIERASPIEATGQGVLTLLLPPPMTREAASLPRRPTRGDTVGAIVFRECSTGELRVQLLRLSATERLVRNGVIQREVDGCAIASPTPVVTVLPPSPVAAVASPASPVAIATKERAGDASLIALLAAAVVAAAVALSAGLILARGRR